MGTKFDPSVIFMACFIFHLTFLKMPKITSLTSLILMLFSFDCDFSSLVKSSHMVMYMPRTFKIVSKFKVLYLLVLVTWPWAKTLGQDSCKVPACLS